MGFRCKLRRAIDGTRTRDFHLGKVALYQLSHYRTTDKQLLELRIVYDKLSCLSSINFIFLIFFTNLFAKLFCSPRICLYSALCARLSPSGPTDSRHTPEAAIPSTGTWESFTAAWESFARAPKSFALCNAFWNILASSSK